MNRHLGYTLIEILIVLLIIGALAGMAITQLFKNVESSRAVEAMESIGTIKRAIEICAMSFNNDFSGCVNYGNLAMIDPSYNAATNASVHFSYTFTTAANSFQVIATRNTLDSGTSTDTITLDRSSSAAVTRSGTTAFVGIQ